MKHLATFIGESGALRLVKGNEYEIEVVGNKVYISINEGQRYTPYGSVKAFLMNWDNIKNVNQIYKQGELVK